MEKTNVPHVLFLPFPAQGHIKPMLSLAELLSHAGFHATFINTDYNNDRLLHNSDISSFHSRFPKFQFISIPDGLPPDHPRSGRLYIRDLFQSSRTVFKPALRQLLISLKEGKGPCQLPTCIIADGILCFAIDVAQEFEIPTLSFRTYSAHCLWTYFHLSKLIEEGEVPFQDENFDKPISCIPGLENVLRRRDLPGICRFENADEPVLQFFIKETSALTRASGLILNTVNEIEAPIITRLGSFFNKIYAIGPLHTLKSRINDSSASNSSNGILWKEDKQCLRCVSEVWKMGFDMKDTCDRSIVEKLVRALMDNKTEEIMASANKLAKLARDSIKEDGSSFINLEKLIQDIKSMTS
ncbi:hypothetical protein Patl1_31757 [Pistacia atlantica]|uniref:Uncharacterized protein n=1 Tax=Pistacia atlantica TaxID=434234 RepID=A0ACC1AQM5_9ROSI|nr:hypothetical protein Patl1_31757 [Pistacia atlantica]